MYQNGRIHGRRIESHAILLGKNQFIAPISEKETHQQAQNTGQQGNDQIFPQYLSQKLHTGTSESTAYSDFTDAPTQTALGHATQIDGRNNKQDKKNDEAVTAFNFYIGLPIGTGGKYILFLVVRPVTVDEFPPVLTYQLVVFVQPTVRLLADGREITTVTCQHGTFQVLFIWSVDV